VRDALELHETGHRQDNNPIALKEHSTGAKALQSTPTQDFDKLGCGQFQRRVFAGRRNRYHNEVVGICVCRCRETLLAEIRVWRLLSPIHPAIMSFPPDLTTTRVRGYSVLCKRKPRARRAVQIQNRIGKVAVANDRLGILSKPAREDRVCEVLCCLCTLRIKECCVRRGSFCQDYPRGCLG